MVTIHGCQKQDLHSSSLLVRMQILLLAQPEQATCQDSEKQKATYVAADAKRTVLQLLGRVGRE